MEIILSEFLKRYRIGVNKATGAALSVRILAEMLGVDKERLTKWEGSETVRGSFPKHQNDVLALKTFFGIDNFTKISESTLEAAIARYPKGMAKVEDLKNVKAQQIPLVDKSQQTINNGLTNNELMNQKHDGGHISGTESAVGSLHTKNQDIPNMENQDYLQLCLQMAKNEAHLLAIVDKLTNPQTSISLNRTGKQTAGKEK